MIHVCLNSHCLIGLFHLWDTSEYSKQFCFLKTLKTELPYDLAIPLLGMYPEKIII